MAESEHDAVALCPRALCSPPTRMTQSAEHSHAGKQDHEHEHEHDATTVAGRVQVLTDDPRKGIEYGYHSQFAPQSLRMANHANELQEVNTIAAAKQLNDVLHP